MLSRIFPKDDTILLPVKKKDSLSALFSYRHPFDKQYDVRSYTPFDTDSQSDTCNRLVVEMYSYTDVQIGMFTLHVIV